MKCIEIFPYPTHFLHAWNPYFDLVQWFCKTMHFTFYLTCVALSILIQMSSFANITYYTLLIFVVQDIVTWLSLYVAVSYINFNSLSPPPPYTHKHTHTCRVRAGRVWQLLDILHHWLPRVTPLPQNWTANITGMIIIYTHLKIILCL